MTTGKKDNTKQKNCKLRRNKLKEDCNLRCECVMAMFTAAVVAESLFGRTTTGICVWSVSSARQSHACVCLLYNALPHLLYCARVAEMWCVCVFGVNLLRGPATPPPTCFYSIQFHQRKGIIITPISVFSWDKHANAHARKHKTSAQQSIYFSSQIRDSLLHTCSRRHTEQLIS